MSASARSDDVEGSKAFKRAWTIQPLGQAWPVSERAWTGLNHRLNNDHPLLCSDFVGPLIDHFGRASDRLAVISDGSAECGMLMLRRDGLLWRSFRPSQAQISPTLLADARLLDCIWPALGRSAVALDLLNQDCEHSALTAQPLHARHEVTRHATTLNVRIDRGFGSYWQSRNPSLQRDIRGKFNRIRSDGLRVEVKVREEPSELHDALMRYAELESRSWKGEQGTALQVGGEQTSFYSDVLERFARHGSASIFELYLGGNLAASEMVVRGGRMAVLLKTTFDASNSRYAPGFVLDYLLLEHEFERRRVAVVEFYTQANEQKLRWGTGARNINHHRLYRWGVVKHAVALARRLRALQTAARTTSSKGGAAAPPS